MSGTLKVLNFCFYLHFHLNPFLLRATYLKKFQQYKMKYKLFTSNLMVNLFFLNSKNKPRNFLTISCLSVQVNDLNVRQLLYASDLLTMPHVMSQCFSYLKSQLTVRNCVKSFLLASAKKSWAQIASFIRNFIIVHFDQVRKFGSIYKLLNKEQFSEIVRNENLNVRYEEGRLFKSSCSFYFILET